MHVKTDNAYTERPHLGALYRRLGDACLPAWLDADLLVAHAAGELSPALAQRIDTELAHSPELAALRDALADLAPASAQLADAVTALKPAAAHRRERHAATRHAVRRSRHQRHARWAGAAAAVLMAVAGVWSWQHLDARHAATAQVPAATAPARSQPDTIFDNGMDSRMAARSGQGSDRIFRAGFSS